jgi:hypothetical protein|tara:strand:+ start:4142 stop:5560 length:1419 start_codon:yes stop_codon:yes gene_type:complete
MKNKNYNQYILLFSSAIYFIIWAQFADSFNPIRPDSSGYLNFFTGTEDGANRPSGYPIFLLLLSNLKFTLIHIGYFQLGVFVCALYFLLNSLLKFGVSKLIVALLFAGLLLNPFFNQFHFTMLTESLSFSFLLMFLGLTLSLYRRITNTKIIVLGIIIGLSVSLKSVSLIFFPMGLIFLIFLIWIFEDISFKKIILSSILLCTPFLVIFSAEKLVFFSAHDEKGSQFAEHFYGKSIMSTTYTNFKILDDGSPESKMLKLLDAKYLQDQEYLESITDVSEKLAIYSLLENDVYKHPDLEHELVLLASESGLQPAEFKKSIIFYSLKNNPTVFLRMTLRHYFSFFNVYPSGKYFNKNGGPPHLINKAINFSPSINRASIHYLFLIFGAIFYLCSILILIKSLHLVFQNNLLSYLRYRPLFFLTLLLAAIVHSIHLSHAFFGVYVPRYLMFSYPYIILLELIVIHQMLKFKKIVS